MQAYNTIGGMTNGTDPALGQADISPFINAFLAQQASPNNNPYAQAPSNYAVQDVVNSQLAGVSPQQSAQQQSAQQQSPQFNLSGSNSGQILKNYGMQQASKGLDGI